VFNLGSPELVVIALIVVLISGATKLPQLGAGLADSRARLRERQRRPERFHPMWRRSWRPWTISDWVLVCAAVFAGGAALLFAVAPPR
jgi:hypothetical protein